MSAQTDNTASVAPGGVEKMKATSMDTESVNPEEVSKPISVNGAPKSVDIKASADDEMEGGSTSVSSHFLLDTTRSQHSYSHIKGVLLATLSISHKTSYDYR